MDNVIEKVKGFALQHGMFSPRDTVIAAVSGGADSVFLLYALLHLRHQFGIRLHVAHLNHGLRRAAGKDQKFVEALSQELGLPITVGVLKKMALKKKQSGDSLEAFARQERFKFLSKTAKKFRARVVALGHTQNDLAETVLMRILRGTGLYGLRGILPAREINGQIYIRPLLEINRREIERFLKKKRIPSRKDETNTSTEFFRNKIRLKLLPVLRKDYNKEIERALANLAKSVSADYDYLLEAIPNHFKKILERSREGAPLVFPIASLKRLHPSAQRLLLRLSIEQLKGDTRRLTFGHIEAIQKIVENSTGDKVTLLPKKLQARRKGRHLIISSRNA